MTNRRNNFHLVVYGDTKPMSRRARKGPGQVIVVDDRGLAGRNHRIIVEVNPMTSVWTIYSIDHRGSNFIASGKFTESGVSVDLAADRS